MPYTIRKTQPSDFVHLQAVEQSASTAFKSVPSLAWLTDGDVMSLEKHNHVLENGFSWVAFDESTQAVMGFITAEIIDDDFYIEEVSVSIEHQKKGIGSNLIGAALKEAKTLGTASATLITFIHVPWNAPYYKRLGFSILKNTALPPYLHTIMQKEKESGLPIDQRCGMRITL